MSKRKATEVSEFLVGSGPDADGEGWYVDLYYRGRGTWLLPLEARRIAKALLRHARVPRKAKRKPVQQSDSGEVGGGAG